MGRFLSPKFARLRTINPNPPDLLNGSLDIGCKEWPAEVSRTTDQRKRIILSFFLGSGSRWSLPGRESSLGPRHEPRVVFLSVSCHVLHRPWLGRLGWRTAKSQRKKRSPDEIRKTSGAVAQRGRHWKAGIPHALLTRFLHPASPTFDRLAQLATSNFFWQLTLGGSVTPSFPSFPSSRPAAGHPQIFDATVSHNCKQRRSVFA